jgi:tetratricopeptide (TPR) repeat protein
MRLYKLYLFFISSLTLWPILVYPQQNKIDSLYTVLKSEKVDSNKVIILDKLGSALEDMGNYPKADSLLNTALRLANEINYIRGTTNIYKDKGYCCYEKGDYSEALKNELISLKLAEQFSDRQGIGNADHDIGLVYSEQGDYPLALEYFLKSLKISEDIGDTSVNDYGNIGQIYRSEGDYPQALKYQILTLNMALKHGAKNDVVDAYINTGVIYNEMGNYTEGLKYHLKAVKLAEGIGDMRCMAYAYGNIGVSYSNLGDYKGALKSEFRSLEIDKRIGDKRGVCFAYVNIGQIYIDTEEYNKARIYLDSALILAQVIGTIEVVRDVYNSKSFLDTAIGDYKSAYADFGQYILYRDSLNNKEVTRKLVSEQLSYDFDRKQSKEKADNTAIAKQRLIIYALSIILLFTLIFGMSRKRRAKKYAE